ncbi:DNA mismatch repair endonuclease MutL [Luteolibacter pohnpeiensis]|uniref:DNA mismatch repair protein MutL n=1 Tax=Luteolibacter pohnpeiensis TaxID=454153 RepID=A0A934S6X4_9BACT|nr:DNA mismatch repair endonuclease MutL [Luteolibacter pohnpeiensis]MBK1880842.1 DNA mismatch repair endonuclease MutL [Luteolibacter pohnpeiensis]
MPKIRVLSDILASQVAAGEVVERPASVVKELVENSIDAGAKEIRVDVDKGGAALIRVSDDGCGMSREDALLSLERHATSKLRESSDLAAVRTLGFRGEAVPSIASVSRFRMVTRETDAVSGTEISVDGGKLRDVRDAGGAPGTQIEAKSLFFNMPARRKFMRAESTESAHVEHQVRLHALAAPWVRFRLRRDDRSIFDLPPVAKAVDRVRQIVGTELARELISLPIGHGNGVSVEGFVLPAKHARKGRRHQFVFLNGRPVEDAVISRALAEGFRGAIADGLHPAAWLWIDLEPGLVDVNVHPAKREVRFHRPLDLRDAILESVTAGLKPPVQSATPVPVTRVESPAVDLPTRSVAASRVPQRPVFSAKNVQPELKWSPPKQSVVKSEPDVKSTALPVEPAESKAVETMASPRARFKVMAMLHQRYVLLESEDGLVVLDPKAAKERILYEAMLACRSGSMATQGLLVPVLLEMDPRDLDLLLRERDALADAGVELDGFGGNTVQVRSLPACLPVSEPRPFLEELVEELLHEATPGKRFAFERLAKILAKRASWLVRPKLAEIDGLLDELFRCDLPYCAADGRPTLTEFSLSELQRRFGGAG